MKKKVLTIIAAVILALTCAGPQMTLSAEAKDAPAVLDGDTLKGVTQEELDANSVMGSSFGEEEDSDIVLFASGWTKTAEGTFRNGNGMVMTGAIGKGVDVSKHNGKINWAKVKAAGVDYAIIRCGYGSNYKFQDDIKWTYNVTQCEKYGIPYGVYLYSYANTYKKVDSEIAHTKRLLKGHHPQYPVYYDLEDRIVRKKGKTFITNAALRYCKAMKSAGYTSGVYASRSWWNSYMTSSSLDSYEKWIAEWRNTGTIYKKPYGMWQCTSKYHVSGISTRVDLNFSYKQYQGNTPGVWAKDDEGRAIFNSFVPLEGGRYDTEQSFTVTNQFITRYNKTYYTSAKGRKYAGFHEIEGKLYYFGSGGVMKRYEWFNVEDKQYRADSKGHLYRDKVAKIGNYQYGFDEEGAMLTGEATIGDKCYRFLRNGISCITKSKANKSVNYRTGPGLKYKKKGALKRGASVYVIRTSGDWSRLSTGYWVKSKYLTKILAYPYDAPVVDPTDPTDPTDETDPTDQTDPTDETGASSSGNESGETSESTGSEGGGEAPAPEETNDNTQPLGAY